MILSPEKLDLLIFMLCPKTTLLFEYLITKYILTQNDFKLYVKQFLSKTFKNGFSDIKSLITNFFI